MTAPARRVHRPLALWRRAQPEHDAPPPPPWPAVLRPARLRLLWLAALVGTALALWSGARLYLAVGGRLAWPHS